MEISGHHLLLVEPDPVLADLASYRLHLLGYRVDVVDGGAAAADRLRNESYQLLITDTKLADGDGLEWLTSLRIEMKSSELPAMVLSLDPSLEMVRRAFLAGAQDYLITPFDPSVLEEKIERLVAGMLLQAT
ncbi:MAG: response regulator [Planctomycetota bacterium]